MAFNPQAFALTQSKITTGNNFDPQAFASKLGIPQKVDLESVEGLRQTAINAGLGEQAGEIVKGKQKLSTLQRLGKALSSFNPAQAISVGQEKGLGAGLLEYPKSILKGLGSAITGTDYEPDRKYFADIAEKEGIENGIAKFGLGFVGDVLLDPTTYFGGAIIKGIGKVAKVGSSVGLKVIGKVAPEVKTGLEMVGTGLQEALGRAFQFGFKSTKGAKEDVLTFLSKEQQAKLGLAASNLDRLGTGVLTQSQREELALKMIAGKRAEFTAREAGEMVAPKIDNVAVPLTQEARKYKSAEEFVKAQGTPNLYKVGDSFEMGKIVENPFREGVPSVEKAQEINKYLQANKDKYNPKYVKFYHGTAKGLPIEEKGLLPTSATRRKSYQSESGYTYLANTPERAKTFGDLGNMSNSDVYEVVVPVNKLLPDLDQLNNIRSMGEKVGNTLGDSIAYGGGVRIKGKIEPYAIRKLSDDFKTKSQLTDIWNKAQEKVISKTPAEIARETALKGTSPEVAKVIEGQITRSKQFAEGITENPYEVYFPFIKNDKLNKFLNETRGIKVGSEGYRKQFKNLLTNENLELDPAKAFFTRESQIVSDKMTREFLEGFVGKYGKSLTEFKNSDEALTNGYQLIKEKGIFGKELGYVSKYDGALIRDSITPEFQTINMLAKATGFDAITSLFKRSVTGLFAPFHIRNFVSGQLQNFEALGVGALNPKNIAVGQKIAYLMGKGKEMPTDLINVAGKETKFKDVMKPFVDRFSGDTFYNTDFDMALKSGSELKSVAGMFSKQRLKETVKTVGLGQEAIPFKVGRAIGQFIEHQQKATAYITALNQGKSIDDALRLAETAGFDYRALTRFESQIMRRLIPFYSFTRKNIELQLKTLKENPERINQILRFFSNLGQSIGGEMSEEEKANLPQYLKESLGVKLKDTPEGLKQYIASFGTPIEAFAQLFSSNPILRALSMTNPILKTPIEIGIGKDSFRQRDLKDVYTANEYNLAPQVIKDLLEIQEVKKPMFKTINGKSVKVGEKVAYIADPEKLLIARSLFTSRGVSYLDQVFDNDLKGFIKVLKTTTGIKPTAPIDIESQKYFNDLDKKRALEDLLSRYGVVKTFKKAYIPK